MRSLTRRAFLKSGVAASAAATVGLPVSQAVLAQAKSAEAGWTSDLQEPAGSEAR